MKSVRLTALLVFLGMALGNVLWVMARAGTNDPDWNRAILISCCNGAALLTFVVVYGDGKKK